MTKKQLEKLGFYHYKDCRYTFDLPNWTELTIYIHKETTLKDLFLSFYAEGVKEGKLQGKNELRSEFKTLMKND